jgi:Domain of unknown function (DUF4391)
MINAASIIAALGLPADARVDQRVPKTLLVENGAPTAADKRQINNGIEELQWVAALKPATIGVPAYSDANREYLEIAVLSLTLRTEAKTSRLTELIHRAIPYPVLLIQSQATSVALSLAHLRWSQVQAGQTVLDGPLVTAALDSESSTTSGFLASLNVASQPHTNLQALYQGWIERFEAYAAAQVTGTFTHSPDAVSAEQRRVALAEHERLTREIAALRARATKESQINRLVDINLEIKSLEACRASLTANL